MVIQRKQTLLLLAALILMVTFLFVPAGTVAATQAVLTCADFTAAYAIAIAACALIAVDIFMFKNLRRQMRTVWLAVILQILAGTAGAIQAAGVPGLDFQWSGTPMLLSCSIILMVLAWLCMRRDYNLLRSVNRFR